MANIRANHVHQATAAIIKRKPIFVCLEDLNVQGMMKNRHLSEKMQICTRSLAGNLSLWSITSNASSFVLARAKADAMNEERNVKVIFSYGMYSFL
jgi:transposase